MTGSINTRGGRGRGAQFTLGKALNDPIQLLGLLGATSGSLLADDDVSVYVGMYEVPICCPPDSALYAHQAMLLQPHHSMVSIMQEAFSSSVVMWALLLRLADNHIHSVFSMSLS